jgi:hypothetical protein
MSESTPRGSEQDPDGDPDMMQTATQPDQAEGEDDPSENGSDTGRE